MVNLFDEINKKWWGWTTESSSNGGGGNLFDRINWLGWGSTTTTTKTSWGGGTNLFDKLNNTTQSSNYNPTFNITQPTERKWYEELNSDAWKWIPDTQDLVKQETPDNVWQAVQPISPSTFSISNLPRPKNEEAAKIYDAAVEKEQKKKEENTTKAKQTIDEYARPTNVANPSAFKNYALDQISKWYSPTEYNLDKWNTEVNSLLDKVETSRDYIKWDLWGVWQIQDMAALSLEQGTSDRNLIKNFNELVWMPEWYSPNTTTTYTINWKNVNKEDIPFLTIGTTWIEWDELPTITVSFKDAGTKQADRDIIQDLLWSYDDEVKEYTYTLTDKDIRSMYDTFEQEYTRYSNTEAYKDYMNTIQEWQEALKKLWFTNYDEAIGEKDFEHYENIAYNSYVKMSKNYSDFNELWPLKQKIAKQYASEMAQDVLWNIYWYKQQFDDMYEKMYLGVGIYSNLSEYTKNLAKKKRDEMDAILSDVSNRLWNVIAIEQHDNQDEHKVREQIADLIAKEKWFDKDDARYNAYLNHSDLINLYLYMGVDKNDYSLWELWQQLTTYDFANSMRRIADAKNQEVLDAMNTQAENSKVGFWKQFKRDFKATRWDIWTVVSVPTDTLNTAFNVLLNMNDDAGRVWLNQLNNFNENYEYAWSVWRWWRSVKWVLPEIATAWVLWKWINKLFEAGGILLRWLWGLKNVSNMAKWVNGWRRLMAIGWGIVQNGVEDLVIYNNLDTEINTDTQMMRTIFGAGIWMLADWILKLGRDSYNSVVRMTWNSNKRIVVEDFVKNNPEVIVDTFNKTFDVPKLDLLEWAKWDSIWTTMKKKIHNTWETTKNLWKIWAYKKQVQDFADVFMDDMTSLYRQLKPVMDADPQIAKMWKAYVYSAFKVFLWEWDWALRDTMLKMIEDNNITIPDMIKRRLDVVWTLSLFEDKSKIYTKIDNVSYKKSYSPDQLDAFVWKTFRVTDEYTEKEIDEILKRLDESWLDNQYVKDVRDVFQEMKDWFAQRKNKDMPLPNMKYANSIPNKFAFRLNQEWFEKLWVILEKRDPEAVASMSDTTKQFIDKIVTIKDANGNTLLSPETIDRIAKTDAYQKLSDMFSSYVC